MALDGRLGDQEPGGSAEPLTARNGRHPRDRDQRRSRRRRKWQPGRLAGLVPFAGHLHVLTGAQRRPGSAVTEIGQPRPRAARVT
jgi:hypothetical protein